MDVINYAGQGMIMSRQNEHGEFEPVKDRKLDKRINMLLSRDLDALQKQHDAYIAAAEKAAAAQQGRRKRVGKWIPLQTIKSNLQMAAAYKKVINQIQEEQCTN